jgi:hypothetical protein
MIYPNGDKNHAPACDRPVPVTMAPLRMRAAERSAYPRIDCAPNLETALIAQIWPAPPPLTDARQAAPPLRHARASRARRRPPKR